MSQKKFAWVILGLAILLVFARRTVGPHSTVTNLGTQPGPIVVLGDSISAGVGSQSTHGYVALLEARTGQKIVNHGVPGDTTGHALDRLRADVLDAKPALVIIELGGNDYLAKLPPAEVFANLDKIITQIEGEGSAVLLLGLRGGLFDGSYANIYSDLAARHHTAYVDNILSGIYGDPSLKSDPIHPNDAGYEKMADLIEPEFRWCLKQMKR